MNEDWNYTFYMETVSYQMYGLSMNFQSCNEALILDQLRRKKILINKETKFFTNSSTDRISFSVQKFE